MSWYSSLFFTFNFLTEWRQHLLLRWSKITYEVAAKSEADFEVFGLSAEENKQFWLKEAKFNQHYQSGATIFLLNSCVLFSIPHYYSHQFDIDTLTYVLMLGLHIAHYCIYCFIFLHAVCTPNLFFVTLLRFFARKFGHIADRLERSLRKDANNKSLNKQILAFHDVIADMMRMNDLFKAYVGFNLLHCFLFITLVCFVSLFVTNVLKIGIYLVLLEMFAFVQVLPFHLANHVLSEVCRSNKLYF